MPRQKQLLEASMKFRSGSSKNTILLCKGRKKELYHANLPNPTFPISTSVELSPKSNSRGNNFILANKKNLHNFFKDRIPHDRMALGQKVVLLSPTKIFKLRKQQNEKQENTKIKLTQSFENQQKIFKTPSTKKMNETFQINDKNKQLCFNSISQNSKCFRLQSSASTYQTPTSSSMVKRSQTVKKQAYISVFGDRLIEQKSRMLEIQSATNLTIYANEKSASKEKLKPRPKTNLACASVNEQRQKLGQLLEKIEGFANFINPHRIPNDHRKAKQKTDVTEIPFETKQELQKNQLAEWIKAVSNGYKQKNLQFKVNRMKTLQDIQQMDPNFYSKMKMHKNGRLWVRNKALGGIQGENEIRGNLREGDGRHRQWQDKSDREDWVDQLLTITDRNGHTIEEIPTEDKNKYEGLFKPRTLSLKEKLANFGSNLIRNSNLARLYSIKTQNIYIAMVKKRKPFELEGSYAFFKYIKLNDLNLVKSFIEKNPEYAHQIDNEYRTPLVYAVQTRSYQTLQFLLSVGVNVDAATSKGQTALSMALANNDYEATEELLRGGASPWSRPHCDLGKLIQGCSANIKVALKNARKVHIARLLIRSPKSRDQFWRNYRQRIQGSNVINFQ